MPRFGSTLPLLLVTQQRLQVARLELLHKLLLHFQTFSLPTNLQLFPPIVGMILEVLRDQFHLPSVWHIMILQKALNCVQPFLKHIRIIVPMELGKRIILDVILPLIFTPTQSTEQIIKLMALGTITTFRKRFQPLHSSNQGSNLLTQLFNLIPLVLV